MPPSGCRAPPGIRRKRPVDPTELSSRTPLRAATLLLSDLDDAVLRPRHGSLDEEQVVLGIDGVDGEADLGRALAAGAAGCLDPFDDARGCRRGADRAGGPDVVRAV